MTAHLLILHKKCGIIKGNKNPVRSAEHTQRAYANGVAHLLTKYTSKPCIYIISKKRVRDDL